MHNCRRLPAARSWITSRFAASLVLAATVAPAQIRFEHRPIAFRLENAETPRKHIPETMAGGVAVFDYNNDGRPDIYFTNGADMPSLKKTSPGYWNRLFRNEGGGRFADVTPQARVAGTGYDTGVAIADYDNDGDRDHVAP